jgi:hypothetical protein
VRIALRTEATELELDVDLTILQVGDKPPVPAAFDLVVDGKLQDSVTSVVGTCLSLDAAGQLVITPGPTDTIRIALPGDGSADLEVWLPHAAGLRIRAVRVSEGAVVEGHVPTRPRWVHYGSSISHCLEATGPTTTWPAAVALRAGWDLQNLAFGGQCMLDPFVARTIRELPADVISLKVGINVVNGDTFRERTFVPALHGFLDTVREGHPDTPIVVITPIICPTAEDAPGPTLPQPDGRYSTVPRSAETGVGALSLSRIRELVGQVLQVRQDDRIHLVDGQSLFDERDVDDLYDGLHPNAQGYLRIADRFFAQVCAPEGLLGRL